MAKRRPSHDSLDQLRLRCDRCWQNDCYIDPLILRARQLRRWGRWRQARSLEQELIPIL